MPLYQILLILLITVVIDWLILRLWRRWKEERKPLHWPQMNRSRIFLVLSLILMVAAQIVMNLEDALIWDKNFAGFLQAVNDGIRFDIDRRENAFIAVLLMIGGAILFSQLYKPVKSIEPFIDSGISRLTLDKFPRIQKSSLLIVIMGFSLFIVLTVRMFLLQVSLLDPILWLFVLALVGFAIASREKQIFGTIPVWNISRTDIMLLLLLFAGGLLVSAFRLTSHPNMLMGDEGNFFDTARSIATGEYLPSFFDMGVYSYPVASSYWQGFIMNWFGVSLWSWRFSSVLISVLAVIPLYLLGLEMFGRRTAILASICFLAAPYFLAFARLGYNNSQSLLPVTLSAFLFYKGWKNRSPFLLYLAGVAAGLGFLTYTAGRISFILGLSILSACILRSAWVRSHRAGLKTYATLTLVFVLGWLISASPHLVYSGTVDPQTFRYKTVESIFFNVDAARLYFSTEEIFSHSPGWLVEPYHLYFNPGIYAWLFQRGFLRTILSFFLPGLIADHFVTSPLPGPISPIFLIIGMTVGFARFRERRYFFLLSWFFLVVILLSTMNTFPPRQTHMVPVIPVMVLLIAVGLDAFIETVAHSWRPHFSAFLRPMMISTISLVVISAGLFQYFSIIPGIFKPDLDQVMNWAELSNHRNVPFFYITKRDNWEKWKPFMVGRMMPDRPFHVISEDDFLRGKEILPIHNEAIIIFHNYRPLELIKKIERDLLMPLKPIPVLDRSGDPIGHFIIIGSFRLPVHPLPFRESVIELLTSPAGYISLILLFAAFIIQIHQKIKTRARARAR
jgi:4-amino-4-deoxy-L-arabinose transferase-like glycosyltransferase